MVQREDGDHGGPEGAVQESIRPESPVEAARAVAEKPQTIVERLKAEQAAEEGPDNVLDMDGALLDDVDLELPDAFNLEIMATELLEHLASYAKAGTALKAARNSGDHPQAEKMYKLMAYSKVSAAIIQSGYPGAKGVADEIARFRAKDVKSRRVAMLEDKP